MWTNTYTSGPFSRVHNLARYLSSRNWGKNMNMTNRSGSIYIYLFRTENTISDKKNEHDEWIPRI